MNRNTSIIEYNICIGGGEKLATKHETLFLGRVPIDPNFGFELDNGRRYVENFEKSATAESISNIVSKITVQIF